MTKFSPNQWVHNKPSNTTFQIKEIPGPHHLISVEGALFMTRNCEEWKPKVGDWVWPCKRLVWEDEYRPYIGKVLSIGKHSVEGTDQYKVGITKSTVIYIGVEEMEPFEGKVPKGASW